MHKNKYLALQNYPDRMISINEFSAIDLRVGRIIEVDDIETARKPMYKLKVDLGELGARIIVAGIKAFYTKEQLLGKSIIVVANLEPKSVAGIMSEGMLLAAGDEQSISIIQPDKEAKPGSKIG
jgi:methionine--tRNA ligase beta chain